MAEAKRKPHPDMAAAMESFKRSREYADHRIFCMSGESAEFHQQAEQENKSRARNNQIPNPPVGEQCLGLLQHSADVQQDARQLEARPEKGVLFPYVVMVANRGFGANYPNAQGLMNRLATESSQITTATNLAMKEKSDFLTVSVRNPADAPDAPPRQFFLSTGVAFDASFSKTVMDSIRSNTIPAKPERNAEDLYIITDSCFRNQGVSITQCGQAGRDQAALYLNKDSATITPPPASLPKNTSSSRKVN